MGSAAAVNVDGRHARAVRTRAGIVDAALALIDGGDLKPTAAAIAARAGLSVRSVYQHFADLEDLFLAVSDRQTNRVARLYTGTSYEGDLGSRIDAFVGYRARLYETIAPIRRAAMLHEPFSPVVASRLQLARKLHRLDVERAFAGEIEAARAAGHATLAETLAAVCSFVVWDEMRRPGGLDIAAATTALRTVVAALLGQSSSSTVA